MKQTLKIYFHHRHLNRNAFHLKETGSKANSTLIAPPYSKAKQVSFLHNLQNFQFCQMNRYSLETHKLSY